MTAVRSLALFTMIGVSSSANAETWLWSTADTLAHVYPEDSALYFIPQGFTNPTSSCPTYFFIAKTDPNYETKAAALLMVFAAGKPLTFVYEAAATGCGSPVDRFIVSN